MSNPIDRRAFLQRSGATGLFLPPSLQGLAALAQSEQPAGAVAEQVARADYGQLVPSLDCPEIAVPAGFRCAKISQAGWMMADGQATPNAFDGMAAFPISGSTVRLVRNHELRNIPPQGTVLAERAYDDVASGGTTTVEVRMNADGSVEKVSEWASLAGTLVNCAGGPTPWGSWLSCEETVVGRRDFDGEPTAWSENHGYIFEVPASADGPVDPTPLRAMGRFVHEAVAIDPQTGIVYETEDQNPGGFYRFLPNEPGNLRAGGKLQMLGVVGRRNYDTRTRQTQGERLPVTWIDINDPDPAGDYIRPDVVYRQGFERGGATFARLEGCWAGEGFIYFDATSGGNIGEGQIWQFIPDDDREGGGELVLVYESTDPQILKQPDNLCMSPRGGLVVCEDSEGIDFLRGISPSGQVFPFARNDLNQNEWAGACFSPQGRTLFVNIQGALWVGDGTEPMGMTFAIWGPWEDGAL